MLVKGATGILAIIRVLVADAHWSVCIMNLPLLYPQRHGLLSMFVEDWVLKCGSSNSMEMKALSCIRQPIHHLKHRITDIGSFALSKCLFHSSLSTTQNCRDRHVSSHFAQGWAAWECCPDSKVHGANMGLIWGRQDPGGPHVGPINLAIWVGLEFDNVIRVIS